MEYVSDLSSCFTTQPLYAFPQILGGQNDHTMFTCMCYDEVNQNLIVAGQSRSQDVIDSGKTPIIIKIDEITGGVVWHKQVDSSQSAVGTELIQECTISEGQQTYYIGVSASPNFAMILLNYLTGDVVQVYYNNPSANTLQKNDNIIGLKMDQNDMIYMATAEGNTFSITAFQHNILQSIIVPVYYKEFGSNSDKFKAITAQFNTNLNRMYIAGDNQKLPFLISFKASDGQALKFLRFNIKNQSSTQSYPISKLGIHQLNSDLQQISCVDGVGVSGQDINFILTQELSGGLQIDIVKSWSFTYSSASSMACLAVTHNTTYLNFLYTTTATESVVNYGYVKISDYTSPLIVIRIQTSVTQISNTLQPKNGFINSQGSKIFDIGSTTAINMQTYPKQVGYVNRYPINSLETCLQYSPQSFQISMTIQTSYSSGYINTLITTLPTSTAQNNKFKIFSSGSYTVGDPVEMSTIPLLMIDKMNLPSPQCVDIPQGIISVPTFNPIYYIIEDSNTVIKNGFSYSRSCSETLTWTYSALLTNGSTLPSFIQFTGVHPQLGFSISTFDQNYAGSIFNIEISGNLNSIKYATTYLDVYVFSNIVPINESPYFIEKVSDSIQITAQQFSFYQLPQTFDPNGDLVTLSLQNQFESGPLPIFIQLQDSKLVFNPLIADIGAYIFIIKVQDNNQFLPMNNQYILKVVVVTPYMNNYPKPNITIIENNQNNQQNSSEFLQKSFSNFSIENLTLSKINFNGQLTANLEGGIFTNSKIKFLKYFLKFTLWQDYTYQIEDISWHILSYSDHQLLIQLDFKDKDWNSLKQNPYSITTNVNTKNSQNQIKTLKVPQMDDNNQGIEIVTSVINDLVMSSVFGGIGASLILGQFMQALWSMINNLQLITHTPLFKIPYTSQIKDFLRAIFNVVTFDPIDITVIWQRMLGLQNVDKYEPYNDRFDFTGYDSTNFIYLIGMPLIFFIIYPAIVLIYFLLKCLRVKRLKFLIDKLRESIGIGSIIRFFMGLQLESSIAFLVCVLDMQLISRGDYVSVILSFLFIAVNLAANILLPFYFHSIKYDMRNKKANEHLGELVKVLRDRSEAGGLYYGIYYLRRVFFIASVFLLEDYLTVQIQLFILSNIFYIIYLIYFRPITVSYNQEVFNELSTLTISYIMLVFTDFLYDNDMKLLMSHVFIIAYSLNICINLIWVILEAILIIRSRIKVYIQKKRKAKIQQIHLLRSQGSQRSLISQNSSVNQLKNTRKLTKLTDLSNNKSGPFHLTVVPENGNQNYLTYRAIQGQSEAYSLRGTDEVTSQNCENSNNRRQLKNKQGLKFHKSKQKQKSKQRIKDSFEFNPINDQSSVKQSKIEFLKEQQQSEFNYHFDGYLKAEDYSPGPQRYLQSKTLNIIDTQQINSTALSDYNTNFEQFANTARKKAKSAKKRSVRIPKTRR